MLSVLKKSQTLYSMIEVCHILRSNDKVKYEKNVIKTNYTSVLLRPENK